MKKDKDKKGWKRISDKSQTKKDMGAQIIRFMSIDIDSSMPVYKALRQIKGIGFMFANAVCRTLNIDKKKQISELSDEEMKKIENTIKKAEFPHWMLNRQKDIQTGLTFHITGADIDVKKREDINLLRKIRAYRGIRHERGLPVRGQRTRSSFRKNKTVGVSKKAAKQQKKK